MTNKQTAVEWLFEQLWDTPKDKLNWYAIRKQAKQMERKQIADFIDKISSLTGCLKLLRDGKKLPFELNDLIDESEYFTKTYENE